MPPQRIALVAIVLLLLAGAGAWWWQARTAVPRARAVQEASTTVVANRISGTAPRAPVASDPEKPDPSVMAAGESAVAEEESSANAGLAGGPAVIATRLSRPDANGTAKGNGLPISMISHSTPTPQAPNRPAQRRARCQARVSTRVPSISSAVATTRAPASTSLRALFSSTRLSASA